MRNDITLAVHKTWTSTNERVLGTKLTAAMAWQISSLPYSVYSNICTQFKTTHFFKDNAYLLI